MSSENLIKSVTATAEIMGTELSVDGARMMCDELAEFPEPMVLAALSRCRRELKGRLTLAEIIARIDDGRPGPNEAWAMCPRSEADSAVWTDEMSRAFFAAKPLIDAGDDVAARMTFIETYQREITQARANKLPPNWWPSLGFDLDGRERALREAQTKGRLSHDQTLKLLPRHRQPSAAGGSQPAPIGALLDMMKKSDAA